MSTKTPRHEEKRTKARSSTVHDTQGQAIKAGATIAREVNSELVVHRSSGQIRETDTTSTVRGGRSSASTVVAHAPSNYSDAEIATDRQRMLQLLERARASAIAEGLPLLDLEGIEEEVASRRGGIY